MELKQQNKCDIPQNIIELICNKLNIEIKDFIPFEEPDAYAIKDGVLYIFEHMSVHVHGQNKKGSIAKQKLAKLERTPDHPFFKYTEIKFGGLQSGTFSLSDGQNLSAKNKMFQDSIISNVKKHLPKIPNYIKLLKKT